jgi:hypothetical protein
MARARIECRTVVTETDAIVFDMLYSKSRSWCSKVYSIRSKKWATMWTPWDIKLKKPNSSRRQVSCLYLNKEISSSILLKNGLKVKKRMFGSGLIWSSWLNSLSWTSVTSMPLWSVSTKMGSSSSVVTSVMLLRALISDTNRFEGVLSSKIRNYYTFVVSRLNFNNKLRWKYLI